MGYQYLEKALAKTVTLETFGENPDELFSSAAQGILDTMVTDADAFAFRGEQPIRLRDRSLDLLLFRFLQEIVFFRHAHGIIVRCTRVRIDEENGEHLLDACFGHEAVKDLIHSLKDDVRGVHFEGLHVGFTAGRWKALVLLEL